MLGKALSGWVRDVELHTSVFLYSFTPTHSLDYYNRAIQLHTLEITLERKQMWHTIELNK